MKFKRKISKISLSDGEKLEVNRVEHTVRYKDRTIDLKAVIEFVDSAQHGEQFICVEVDGKKIFKKI